MSENTKTKDERAVGSEKILRIFIVLLIAAVFFSGLTVPLLGPDEPRYSQVAREMFERGDWITPTLGGFDWFEKPALLYWLQIAFYNLFGVSEFSARFGSALFGLGIVLSLWLLGRLANFGGQAEKSEPNEPKRAKIRENDENFSEQQRRLSAFRFQSSKLADWLALICASAIGIIVFAHAASFDIILTFPLTAALVGFFIAESSAEKRGLKFYLSLAFFYFFIGIALIAKGLVGILFPFAIVGFYYVLSWRFPHKNVIFSFFWGTILSLLVACLWYLPMYQVNGWKFVDEFFIQHHFQRYTSNKYQHPQPFYFFFWVLPLMTIPWLPFFLAAIRDFVKEFLGKRRNFFKSADETDGVFRLKIFAFAWLLVPLVFFSLSGSKLPGYILPSLPPALILTGIYVYEFTRKSEQKRKIALILAAAMLTLILAILLFALKPLTNFDTVKNLIQTANQRGYTNEKILNMHTISHNAEFYGAGRLARDAAGKLKRFDGVSEVIAELEKENRSLLVLVPPEYVNQLTGETRLQSEVLETNGELTIVAVKLK